MPYVRYDIIELYVSVCLYIKKERDASASSIGQRKTKTTMVLANKARSIYKQIRNDTSSTVCIASQWARKTCHIHLILHAHALSCKNHLLISPVAIGYQWISCTVHQTLSNASIIPRDSIRKERQNWKIYAN